MTQRQTLEINTTFQINGGRSDFFRKDIGNYNVVLTNERYGKKFTMPVVSADIHKRLFK